MLQLGQAVRQRHLNAVQFCGPVGGRAWMLESLQRIARSRTRIWPTLLARRGRAQRLISDCSLRAAATAAAAAGGAVELTGLHRLRLLRHARLRLGGGDKRGCWSEHSQLEDLHIPKGC